MDLISRQKHVTYTTSFGDTTSHFTICAFLYISTNQKNAASTKFNCIEDECRKCDFTKFKQTKPQY